MDRKKLNKEELKEYFADKYREIPEGPESDPYNISWQNEISEELGIPRHGPI